MSVELDKVVTALRTHLKSGTLSKSVESERGFEITIVSPGFTRGTLAKIENEFWEALEPLRLSGALSTEIHYTVTTGYQIG